MPVGLLTVQRRITLFNRTVSEMKKLLVLAALTALVLLVFFLALPFKSADAATVFSDNFSTGNFDRWARSYTMPGASQIVKDEVARFTVPPPSAGTSSYSYVVKDGLTSTASSIIVASQDIFVTNVPNGEQQGNGAIFFLYICDSTNLNGNYGNVGVGIDGSSVWSLWIGGSASYTYIFQTAGPTPASNTWYHLSLTLNNQKQTVSLEVDGVGVITASQQQFTDKTHPVSLMSGMGENWWSDGSGQVELRIDNVQLDISDSQSATVPAATPKPALPASPTPTLVPTPSPVQTVTQTPSVTLVPLNSSALVNPTSSLTQPDMTFDLTAAQVGVLAGVIVLLVAVLWHKR
jgi:hypothetical protein